MESLVGKVIAIYSWGDKEQKHALLEKIISNVTPTSVMPFVESPETACFFINKFNVRVYLQYYDDMVGQLLFHKKYVDDPQRITLIYIDGGFLQDAGEHLIETVMMCRHKNITIVLNFDEPTSEYSLEIKANTDVVYVFPTSDAQVAPHLADHYGIPQLPELVAKAPNDMFKLNLYKCLFKDELVEHYNPVCYMNEN